jgi:hypothetical protein
MDGQASGAGSRFRIVGEADLRRLLTIASRHKVVLAVASTGFFLATPLFVIVSLWVKTGLVPNRLEVLTPALRLPSSGLSLVTVRAVGVIGGWEYELTVRGVLMLLLPAILFGLYVSVIVAVLRAWKTRTSLRVRKSPAGAAGGLLAFLGNVLAAGISLTPPCIGVITTVSILGLLGFGAGVVILPYLYLVGSLIMLVSVMFLVRKVDPGGARRMAGKELAT